MSRVLEAYGPCVSTELQIDMGYGEGGRDFLKETKLLAPIIITNPPFNLSIEFIKHSLDLGAMMGAMLLKSQYWHGANRYQFFKEHPPAYVLPLTWRPDFDPPEITAKREQEKGCKKSSPTMEVAWSVWQIGKTATRYIPLPRPRAAGVVKYSPH